MLSEEHDETTTPTINDNDQEGPDTRSKSVKDPDSRQSTTQSSNGDAKHAATDGADEASSEGNNSYGSRTTDTTTYADGRDDDSSVKYNDSENVSVSDPITRKPAGVDGEPTTTSYEEYLKSIKLNLGLDFDLEDLGEEQRKNLEDLSKAYGLDRSSDQVVIDAIMKQALQTVAAKMSPVLRQILGFQLKDLVSSCIMNGDPCDTNNDFKQTFDVDYGNCYTFNHDTPVKYVTRRAGTSYGLRMTIVSNSTESLLSSSEEGVKIVVHSQNITPFPNVEGLKSSVGRSVSLPVTYGKLSKLGEPYGQCSSLESIAQNKQPFYYNGSYTIEGCFRSCFQRNIATACGCADSRFPTPTDMNVPFCDPLEPTKYKCMNRYIEDIGDYFFVKNCECYDACGHAAYKSQISESPWPAGGFFYGAHCPLAAKLNFTDCSQYYRNNAMRLEVSFAQLGYAMLQEEPASTAWGLFNKLAGSADLWVGAAIVGFVELVLVGIQICLWICRCSKELPEVPSLRRRNFTAKVGKDSDHVNSTGSDAAASCSEASDAASEPSDSMNRLAPKNFPNSFGETVLTRREVEAQMPTKLEVYDPNRAFESVNPILAQSSEPVGHFAHV
ncbi:degenerin unc-8 [Aphelenchoides avenae]|nr:degenerin unc-8 [Aphelenchus avenae]